MLQPPVLWHILWTAANKIDTLHTAPEATEVTTVRFVAKEITQLLLC
jgi:hypothetical protein